MTIPEAFPNIVFIGESAKLFATKELSKTQLKDLQNTEDCAKVAGERFKEVFSSESTG